MRAFVALDLPDDMADALDRLQDKLTVGRHVPADDFHLTLAFLGDTTPDTLEELHHRLDMMTWPVLSLAVTGIDIFGTANPRALYARIDGGAPLSALQKRIETFARAAGIDLPRRRFVPHVTLARFSNTMPEDQMAKVGRFLSAHGDWTMPPFAPPSLTLYRSHLSEGGPIYEALERYGPAGPLGDQGQVGHVHWME
ncbi:RNA 2',3'-cyclic phosphodiesterase [Oceaniglobus indicus]|uniref:RNA 2',3'-cyclic phosphodiesterase n=1 Tax=Oceaniglobus indicus TaxID=2047749 RepID=UPI000C1A3A58|nr:RNA 2',3'-cyclic phosphodiesterase [Oceaniglobus indicus]